MHNATHLAPLSAPENRVMQRLKHVIAEAQSRYAALLETFVKTRIADKAIYQRYLSMQYHLSKGIQRDFMLAAAHSDLNKRRTLRACLVDFANERELHYLLAASDLQMLGLELLQEPLDATLWHAYFDKVVSERPFIRLGAACCVETISGGIARSWAKAALVAPFLNRDNTKFIALREDGAPPGGALMLAIKEVTNLREHHLGDLVLGAKQGAVFYIRLMEWVLHENCLSAWTDNDRLDVGHAPARDDSQPIRVPGMTENLAGQAS